MTKQEKIREGLAEKAHLIWQRWMAYMLTHLDEEHIERWKRQANMAYSDLLDGEKVSDQNIADEYSKYLHSQGVVIKVERELPKYVVGINATSEGAKMMAIEVQEDMLKAGYIAVEPLINKQTP